ncbi:MAG: alanine dehydrogenase, partial [Mucilaginibacter sp.]|nr:alanine dehydrogenase [Mucilaginibacter sp.]
IDGRANYITADRFPNANKLIVAKPDTALSKINFDNRTAFVLMTHNYNYDMAILKQLLPLQLHYIGALGPKKRLNRMLDELIDEGVNITADQLNSIYGPAGLDIGSENAEEIALSIIAEIQAVLKNRNGLSLRNKTVIHNRNNEQIIKQILPIESANNF